MREQGPAAGLVRPGDVIFKIDGKPISDAFDFALTIAGHAPNERLTLQVQREGKQPSVELTLAELPKISWEKVFAARFGIQGQDLTDALVRNLQLRVRQGVLVTAVGTDGPADRIGLERGDVIVQIGAHAVRNMQDAGEAVMRAETSGEVLIGVIRGRYKLFAQITLNQAPPI